jgi:methionyl-tRNA formyltransferase
MRDVGTSGASAPSGPAPGAQPPAAPGTVLAASHDGIDVACGSGVLRILRLQLAGRNPILAREFIKGQRLDGARFAPA